MFGKKSFLTLLLVFAMAVPALAYRQSDVDQLQATRSCPGGDLRGAYLRDADLTGANLQGADLSYANLTNAILEDADLKEANLQKASLRNAYMAGSDLERTYPTPIFPILS